MERKNRPLFSVIVPIYKVEKYLHQCVDSILAQTFADFEVILVDDGSPDNCGAICDEYAAKDPRVKVVHKENGGLVSARRAGYGISTGQYIVNVDSDDFVSTDLLAMVEEAIRTHSVDAVLYGYVYFNEHTQEYHPQGVAPGLYDGQKMDTIRANLILGAELGPAIHCNLWALAMRKEILMPHAAAVPEKTCRGEDMAAVIPALDQCSSVYVLEQCPYQYRITPGSMTNFHRGDELDQILQLAAFLTDKLGTAYDQKLDSFVLQECYSHLTHYRRSWKTYWQEVSRIRDDRLVKHLRGARSGKKTSLPDRVVYFLLRHQMFRMLWLIWKIRG